MVSSRSNGPGMAASAVGEDPTSPVNGERDIAPRDTAEEGVVEAASKCSGAASDTTDGLSVGASVLIEGGGIL